MNMKPQLSGENRPEREDTNNTIGDGNTRLTRTFCSANSSVRDPVKRESKARLVNADNTGAGGRNDKGQAHGCNLSREGKEHHSNSPAHGDPALRPSGT